MKDESDDSGIIVYEIRDDYSAGSSSKSKKKTATREMKDASSPDHKRVDGESMAQLGGFSGRVYDKLTHRTIEGVVITIAKDLSVKTDKKGIFSVVGIKPGKYHITAFEDGYVVHSCKGRAVAGETTTLESFNLIPDCLAAQYPEGMAQEEEETAEEEVVEFAMESPQATPSEKLPEKTIKVRSDDVPVRDIRKETVPDLYSLKTINEDKTVENPEAVVDEVTAHQYAYIPPDEERDERSIKEIISVLIEQIAEKPFIIESSLNPIDTAIVEAVQPEWVPEKLQGVASDAAPQEEPLIDAFLEEMQTPVIGSDSTEAVAFIPEEIIIDELSSIPVEATIAEALQPEESPDKFHEERPGIARQEPLVKESRLRQLWGMFRGIAQKETDQEHASEPSTEETIEQALPIPEHRGQPTESSIETVPEAIFPEDVIEARLDEQPVNISLKGMQTPVIESNSAEAVISVPKEVIIKETSSVEEFVLSHVEISNIEMAQSEDSQQEISIEETSVVIIIEDVAFEEIKEAAHEEEHPGTLAAESIEEAPPLMEYQAVSLEPFVEIAPEIVLQEELFIGIHEEKPTVIASFEEMQPPVITEGLTDITMPVPEEIIIGGGPSAEELSSISAETSGEEVSQSEEAPQEPSAEKPRSQLPEKTVRHKKGKEKSAELSPETIPQTVLETEISEEAREKEEPLEITLDEVEAPVIVSDSTKTPLSVPEEIIVKNEPSVEETPITPVDVRAGKAAGPEEVLQKPSAKKSRSKLSWLALRRKKPKDPNTEQTIPLPERREQPVKPSMNVPPQIVDHKDILEESCEEEQPLNIVTEEALEHGAVDEICVTLEETPEDTADYDIATLSDEERAAMSSEDDMAKAAGFEGSMNAQPNPAFKGLPVTIAYHLRNVVCDDPDDFIIQIIVVRPDTGTIHETFEAPVTCAKDTFLIGGFTFSTAPYEAFNYAISMQIVSKMTKSAHFLDGISLEIKNIF